MMIFCVRKFLSNGRLSLQYRNIFSFKKGSSISPPLSSSLSPSGKANALKEKEILQLIREISEPITNRRIGALGCIQRVIVDNESIVKITLDTFVPGYQYQQQIREECANKLKGLSWIKDHQIEFITKAFPTASSSSSPSDPASSSSSPLSNSTTLSKIHHIIGVSSCKGGVGKSTVAVNLACALAMKPGLRVGILDADIYGPSLPIQLKPDDYTVKRSPMNPDRFILPLISKELPNLKILSFGFVNPNSGVPGSGGKSAALMRGPMASKVINQLLLATDWGELDYLIVDMPPGTSDIHLTLSQTAQFTGAVIVTTPHLLSLVDAAKGVELFRSVNIPTLALVENMSYFKCDAGKIYHPFGKGGRDALLQSLNLLHSNNATTTEDIKHDIENAPYFSLPLCMEGAGMTVEGKENKDNSKLLEAPLVLSCPEIESAKVYHSLASEVINEIFKLQAMTNFIPSIFHDQKANGIRLRYFTSTQAMEYFLSSEELRRRDTKTGQILPDYQEKRVSGTPLITKIDIKGVYGVGIVWSDRSDIFPFDILKQILDELQETR